ncbi:putative diphthamide synthesis protein-domain-containing protein [Infundibulicybe gibba]|nr:putative diphthamide synthesis protein-domain-containing protein [Infundibulicybe gibba]
MASAFSTAPEAILAHTITPTADPGLDFATPALSTISLTSRKLLRRSMHMRPGTACVSLTIALQFPDELLRHAVPVYTRLKALLRPGQELYVLADTSYGSCCVDEVAAQHVDAEVVVHFGHACMSRTARLPVLYVFGKRDINIDDCVAQVCALPALQDTKTVRLRHDVMYAHQAVQLGEKLRETGLVVLYNPVPTYTDPAPPTPATKMPPEPTSDNPETILYIGGETLALTTVLMTNPASDVYSYDPTTRVLRPESVRTNRLLMRRYVQLQKARDADVVAILVGTLGVASYLPLIRHLRALLARHHRKSYLISVGKLSPSKLANFLEIDAFVLVACPETSLVDAKEFLRPIVTPYELEVALQAEQNWGGRYVLDFDRLLADPPMGGEGADSKGEGDPEQPVFSLITGTYRHAKRYGNGYDSAETQPGVGDNTTVVLRNQDNALVGLAGSAAGNFLRERTYQGLEMRLGLDGAGVLEQGRSGVARGYADDHRSEE